MADDAITLVRQNDRLTVEKSRNCRRRASVSNYSRGAQSSAGDRVFSDDVRLEAGALNADQVRVPDANVIYRPAAFRGVLADGVLKAATEADKIVVAVYASPTAGRWGKAVAGCVTRFHWKTESCTADCMTTGAAWRW